MKRIMLFLCTLLLLIGAHDVTDATLMNMTDSSGDVVVYEDTGEQYWYYDLGYCRNKTYDEQITAIEYLNDSNYYGLDTWHLASQTEFDNLLASMDVYDSDVDNHFLPTITSLNPYTRTYSGIIDVSIVHTMPGPWGSGYTEHAVETFTAYGSQGSVPHVTYDTPSGSVYLEDYLPSPYIGAWITTDGTPTCPGPGTNPPTVPEPTTMLLFGAGLVGLAGFGRKKFRK